MSAVDLQGFIPLENNAYIYLEIKPLSEEQICKFREFKPRKVLSNLEDWVNYRLHRLWHYSLHPFSLWNDLTPKKCDTGEWPESQSAAMAVTCSILRADGRALQWEWGFTWPLWAQQSFCLVPFRVHLQLLCLLYTASHIVIKATLRRSQNHGFFLNGLVMPSATMKQGTSLGCSVVFLQNVLMESGFFFFFTKSFMDIFIFYLKIS